MDYGYNATLFERETRKEIDRRRAEIEIQIVSGNGITDFADYRRLVGYVAAFDEVLQMLDAVRTRLMKPPE